MATDTRTEISPEDLLLIDDRPMPELVDGELLERGDMGQQSEEIATLLCHYLLIFVLEGKLGRVIGGQGGYQIFPDDPRKVRVPDVSFTRMDRLPGGRVPTGHGRVAPDLVVEVNSPNDLASEVERKIADYLAAGIALIWVLDPPTQSIRVIRPDGTGQRLTIKDTLDGEDVLPGFRCEVAKLFE